MDPNLKALKEKWGINFMDPDARLLAMDAQPTLTTSANSGILSVLSTIVDPKVIEVLFAPLKAVEIAGQEIQKGDWTTTSINFMLVEHTGETSSYGDHSTNGNANANVNWIPRQPYHYQTFTNWGELEVARMGLTHMDWVSQKNLASIDILKRFQNSTYFKGVAGLQNYGIINDPGLPAPITPAVNASGGIGWGYAANPTTLEIIGGVRALFAQLQKQAGGLLDRSMKMTLAISPSTDAEAMTSVVTYGLNVADFLKKDFPNLTVKTAPEYATASGNLAQLFLDEYNSQKTMACAFTEKLRSHPVIVGHSDWSQKKSQGTFGGIVFQPMLVASMLGV